METGKKYSQFISSLPDQVKILAVSKTKSDEEILELYHLGHRDFGENYVQELIGKYERLPKDIRWHFIGHLQSNKVKYIAPFVHLIHSVDSLKLLSEINKQALKNNRIISVLLQCYIGNEETKFGLEPEFIHDILKNLNSSSFENVQIAGFMAMGTNTEDENIIRNEFHEMKILFEACKKYNSELVILEILSMGMSSDYRIAIENGSNLIRIGSLIFGERNYSKKN